MLNYIVYLYTAPRLLGENKKLKQKQEKSIITFENQNE